MWYRLRLITVICSSKPNFGPDMPSHACCVGFLQVIFIITKKREAAALFVRRGSLVSSVLEKEGSLVPSFSTSEDQAVVHRNHRGPFLAWAENYCHDAFTLPYNVAAAGARTQRRSATSASPIPHGCGQT